MRKTSLAVMAASFASTMALAGSALTTTAMAQSGTADQPRAQRDAQTPSRDEPGKAIERDANRTERDTRNQRGEERATGDQLGPPAGETASESQIRAMLEKQGYSDIQNLKRDGAAYTATAMKNGKRIRLHVDPQLGQVQELGG